MKISFLLYLIHLKKELKFSKVFEIGRDLTVPTLTKYVTKIFNIVPHKNAISFESHMCVHPKIFNNI